MVGGLLGRWGKRARATLFAGGVGLAGLTVFLTCDCEGGGWWQTRTAVGGEVVGSSNGSDGNSGNVVEKRRVGRLTVDSLCVDEERPGASKPSVRVAEGHAGTVICEVDPESPAEKAGLRIGDRVVAIGGQPVACWDLVQHLLRHRTGEVDLVLDTPGRRQHRVLLRQAQIKTRGRTQSELWFGARPCEGLIVIPDHDLEMKR